MLREARGNFLGKVADDLQQALARQAGTASPGRADERPVARGEQWSVSDVICTSGPHDRPFEEQHDGVSIAVVVAGTFQYRSPLGTAMLTPGSLLLGNPGQCFECGHEHAAGDRCIAFRYAPELFAEIGGGRRFRASHLPPLPELSRIATRVAAGAALGVHVPWEETAIELAAAAIGITSNEEQPARAISSGAVRRVTESVRRIEAEPDTSWTLARLAAEARQSRYHYLRLFQQVTGVTPHQFVLRARLRAAALKLVEDDAKIIDVAFGAGFGDVSNFNAAFRREFGVSPRSYRVSLGRRQAPTAVGCARLTPPAPIPARTFATISTTRRDRR
jgi:AraC family transcriptional regulator